MNGVERFDGSCCGEKSDKRKNRHGSDHSCEDLADFYEYIIGMGRFQLSNGFERFSRDFIDSAVELALDRMPPVGESIVYGVSVGSGRMTAHELPLCFSFGSPVERLWPEENQVPE